MAPRQPDSEVDVLIVGAGPAGLMMANWMSRCGVKTRIVDKRGTKVFPLSARCPDLRHSTHNRFSMARQMASNAVLSKSSTHSTSATGLGENQTTC